MNIIIPRQLKIGGFTYAVEYKEHDEDLRSRNRYGEHHASTRKIILESSFSAEQVNNTFLHEILHAIDAIYNNDKLQEEDNERISYGLHQIFEQLNVNFIQVKE